MRSATRLGIIVLLGLFLALPAVATVSAASAAPVARHAAPVDRVVAPPTTTSPGASAPAGPKLTPDTAANKAEQRRKLIMGVTSVVLIVIVIWGRSIRRKRKKAAEANTSA